MNYNSGNILLCLWIWTWRVIKWNRTDEANDKSQKRSFCKVVHKYLIKFQCFLHLIVIQAALISNINNNMDFCDLICVYLFFNDIDIDNCGG